MKGIKKKIAAVGAAGVTLVGVGTAYALWTADGTGSGSSKALTAQSVTVSATTPTADLYPGFTQGDVFFTLTNNNPYAITFTSMTAGTVTSSDEANCPASNVTVADASGLSIAAPAGGPTAASIADVVSMASAAPDGCQGVTFTIGLTLSGTQS
ncbi:MAG TPA: hypothetical protein VJ831_03390 [Jatrophihabitantaceae bacterium]|nr:hypothetical protein [Jatrophihabitantaceae bacterium]